MVTRTVARQSRSLTGIRGGNQRILAARHFSRPDRRSASERDRVVLALARFIGFGYVLYAVVVIPQLVDEAANLLPGWYPPVAAVLSFGFGIAMLVSALVKPWHRAVGTLAILAPVGLIVAGLLWLVASRSQADAPASWILDFAGLAGLTVILVRPLWEGILSLATCKLLGAAVAVNNVVDPDVWGAVEEAFFGIAFTSVFLLLASRVLKIGSELDESRDETERAVARGVANVELARVDALIHDHVLSTFNAVGADRDDPRVTAQAAGALAALEGLVGGDPAAFSDIPGREVVARLRAVIAELDSDLPVTVEVADDATSCPIEVAAALAEAAAEAVRNSAEHAGDDAQTAIFLGISRSLVQVVIADDGSGFDPDAVPEDRLGLALSIRHRIGVLPGGEAAVVSSPGAGTTVSLRWLSDLSRRVDVA
ncbi:ATP-binding protein [Gordonia sp. (in: high G+C Gram-positive bacteria)]|uniref:ATP-binding protein n=1 Tax=Gordonia sp. (in: high G+C Gram-positive bacteria) TaxID=84139 RepID=UPI003C789DE6